MKKILSSLSLALSLALFATTASADVIISADDFDGNSSGAIVFENQIAATAVADPLDATNMVRAIDIEPGGQWGTYVQVNPGIALAAFGLSAGDALNYSFDVLVPAGTTAGATDSIQLIVRWGELGRIPVQGVSSTGNQQFIGDTSPFVVDTWQTISGSFTIPAENLVPTAAQGGPVAVVTHFNPIWSFRDVDDDAVAGTTVLVDNWSLSSPFVGTTLLGDVNLDEAVDFLDITAFIALLSAGGFQSEADCNEDGTVDFLDITAFIGILSAQ